MSEKIRDLAVKVGTYTDGAGNEKARWQNLGALMRSDDGGEFILLDRTFNPAGVPVPSNGGNSVLISAFKIRGDDGQRSGGQQSSPPADPTPPPDDDEIPF